MSKIKTVFIVGPTASGKTGLGILLAEKFSGEVISADSMQIYKGIHIASAAPDAEEMRGIPHHLLEFLEPSVSYSVADYVKAARVAVSDIDNRGNLPIVVGGTGLYISSLADNTEYTEEETDYLLRQKLESRFDEIGLHPNNRRRIIRAFEVYKTTGKTITEQNELSHTGEQYIEPLLIGINYRDREKLYERINLRVDIMLENGLLEEAKIALSMAGGAVQAIGHKELAGFLKGEGTLDEAAENLKRQTRRYAKRQMTWFNRDKRINWIYIDETENVVTEAERLIKEFLEREETV